MKNLENFSSLQVLSNEDLKNYNGGIVCGGFCIAGAALLVGGLVGWAVSEVVHHHS